jgi:hypothetical protein
LFYAIADSDYCQCLFFTIAKIVGYSFVLSNINSNMYIFLKESRVAEIVKLRKLLDTEASQKEKLEEEIAVLKSQLLEMSLEAEEV